MFSQNELVRRGKVYYDEMIEAKRAKDDEKRHITQRIVAKRARATEETYSSGFMTVPHEEVKRRPRAKEDTVKISNKFMKGFSMNKDQSFRP